MTEILELSWNSLFIGWDQWGPPLWKSTTRDSALSCFSSRGTNRPGAEHGPYYLSTPWILEWRPFFYFTKYMVECVSFVSGMGYAEQDDMSFQLWYVLFDTSSETREILEGIFSFIFCDVFHIRRNRGSHCDSHLQSITVYCVCQYFAVLWYHKLKMMS